MILIDTSIYIEAAEKEDIRKILQDISKKYFVQSCDPIEREVNKACDFLRSRGKRDDSEKLRIIYNETKQGVIRLSDRILDLTRQYAQVACHLSKDQHKRINNDLRIVASASVASVETILSFNRKTMASEKMVEAYNTVNKTRGYRTPIFITTIEGLRKLLQS
ncbi:MAG TPA: hypothetical protein VJB06_02025 [archaeon]|nr:hypothetical protein [archaeon]